MKSPKLIPNAGTVAVKSASLWALYGTFVVDVSIKILEYVQNHREVKWQDAILPIALIIAGALRLVPQQSITSDTERQLAKEKLTRMQLEVVATSDGPPITARDVADIKQASAAAVSDDISKE